jgi:hypothetical protein
VGVIILLVFAWRFARTRQLYLTTLVVQARGAEPIRFSPHDLRSFVELALLGHRSMTPGSFFVRAFVFVAVAACLLPFKDYAPSLYWLVVVLVALYGLWCVGHGLLLKKRLNAGGAA